DSWVRGQPGRSSRGCHTWDSPVVWGRRQSIGSPRSRQDQPSSQPKSYSVEFCKSAWFSSLWQWKDRVRRPRRVLMVKITGPASYHQWYMNSAAKRAENLATVRGRIADAACRSGRADRAIRLVAVTKYVGTDAVRDLIAAGCRDLGESRPQE